jgi:hypothetical protein
MKKLPAPDVASTGSSVGLVAGALLEDPPRPARHTRHVANILCGLSQREPEPPGNPSVMSHCHHRFAAPGCTDAGAGLAGQAAYVTIPT